MLSDDDRKTLAGVAIGLTAAAIVPYVDGRVEATQKAFDDLVAVVDRIANERARRAFDRCRSCSGCVEVDCHVAAEIAALEGKR